MLPDAASDAPRAQGWTYCKPEDWVTDTSKRSHHTNLNPWIAASSMSTPFARSSSSAKSNPMIGAATYG